MLQAWKKRNVPFYDSEDLFFPKLLSFYMTACKKKFSCEQNWKERFFCSLRANRFYYVTVIFRIVNRRISSVDMMTVLCCINLG